MSPKKRSTPAVKKIESFLVPDYMLFCKDILWSHKREISFISVRHAVKANELPYELQNFWLVASFLKNPSISAERFNEASYAHQVFIVNPEGKEVDLGTYEAKVDDTKNPIYRLLLELSQFLTLTMEGLFKIEVYQTSNHTPRILVFQQYLPVYVEKVLDSDEETEE